MAALFPVLDGVILLEGISFKRKNCSEREIRRPQYVQKTDNIPLDIYPDRV